MKMEYVLQAANSRTSLSFPHACSGNLGGIRSGPPIKTFGGDDLGELHLFTNERAKFTKDNVLVSLLSAFVPSFDSLAWDR
jgi:hypothetical protein